MSYDVAIVIFVFMYFNVLTMNM